MPGAGRPGGRRWRPEPRPPLEPRPRALRRTRSPQPILLPARRSPLAAGARNAGGARWERRTRGTGPESCKLCAGLARRGSRSAPGRSPGAAAGRAPGGSGGSGGAEGGVSGRRSPGQRAALFTAGPPSSPARALRAPDIIHSRTLASPLLLPAVTHPGPEAPAGSSDYGRLTLSGRLAELEKPVRLLRGGDRSRPTLPSLCGPRRCREGGAWQAARGGSGPQA